MPTMVTEADILAGACEWRTVCAMPQRRAVRAVVTLLVCQRVSGRYTQSANVLRLRSATKAASA